MTRRVLVIALLLAMGGTCSKSSAQTTAPPDSLSEGAIVSVLTVSPGPMGVSSAGHTALRIQDPAYNMDMVVNYTTRPSNPVIYIARLVFGIESGYVHLTSLSEFLFPPSLQKRTVYEQLLDLTPSEQFRFWQHVRRDLFVERQTFTYNLLEDNCTTRVRDHIAAIPGVHVPNVTGSLSPRETLAPYFEKRLLLKQVLSLTFGLGASAVTSESDANYMPLDFHEALRQAKTSAGLPLVGTERQILEYSDVQVDTPIPGFRLTYLFLALMIGGISLRSWGKGTLSWSVLDRVMAGLLGLIGLGLAALWLLGAYGIYAQNLNLLWAIPTHAVAVFWSTPSPVRRWYIRMASLFMVAAIVVQVMRIQPLDPGLTLLLAVICIRWWTLSREIE